MSRPSNPAELAQSLSDELHESHQSSREETIRELKAILAAVPARSEFTDTRKILLRMAASSAVMLILAGAFFQMPDVKVAAPIGIGLLGLFAAFAAFQHRNDGKRVIMTLTHTELRAPNLAGPVPLSAITELELVEASQTYSNLHVDDEVKLPAATRIRGILPSQVLVFDKKKNRKVVLASAGLCVNGRKLSLDEGVELFEMYLAAAAASAELARLNAQR